VCPPGILILDLYSFVLYMISHVIHTTDHIRNKPATN